MATALHAAVFYTEDHKPRFKKYTHSVTILVHPPSFDLFTSRENSELGINKA
jgi:hypothetical protein